MSSIGFFQMHAYTSGAQLPLKDVAVVLTAPDRTGIAIRLTDSSGLIHPLEIPVPDKDESQEPDPSQAPYTLINLYAYLNGYELVIAEDIQIFADTTTYQDLEMIPLSDCPAQDDEFIYYDTPPQDL